MTGEVNNVHLAHHLMRLRQQIDMETHRVALILNSGSTYFVRDMLEEWDNAVYFRPEGHEVQPVLVFKGCIEAVKIMDRPTPRKKEHDK